MDHHHLETRDAKKKKVQDKLLSTLVDNLSTYGQLLNLAAIRHQLKQGTLSLDVVVAELLDVRKDFMQKAKQSGNFNKLSATVEGVSTEVVGKCGVTGEHCGELDKVQKGVEGIASIDAAALGNYETALEDESPLDAMVAVKTSLPVGLQSKVQAMMSSLDATPASNISPSDKIDVVFVPRKTSELLLNTSKIFSSKKFSQAEMDKLKKGTLQKALSEVTKVNPMVVYKGERVDFEWVEERLTTLINTTSDLRTHISDERMSFIKEKTPLYGTFIGRKSLSIDEKEATHGFHEGYKSLKTARDGIKSKFVKTVVISEEGLAFVKELEGLISIIIQEMKPFMISSVHSSVPPERFQEFVDELELAVTELDNFKQIEPLQQCTKKLVTLMNSLRASDWSAEQNLIGKVGDELSTYATKFNAAKVETTEIQKFWNALDGKNSDQQFDIFVNYAFKSQLKSELEGWNTTLVAFETEKVAKWREDTKIEKLLSQTRDVLKKNNGATVASCLGNKTMITDAQTVIGKGVELLVWKHFGSLNDSLVENFKAAESTEDKLIAMAKNPKKIPLSGVDPKWKTPLQTSVAVNTANEILIDLNLLIKNKDALQRWLDSEKTFREAVNKHGGTETKTMMATFEEYLAHSKTLMKIINKADSIQLDEPSDLKSYSKVYKQNFGLDMKEAVDFGKIVEVLKKCKATFAQPSDEKTLSLFKLNFVNGHTTLGAASTAFLVTIPFFTDLVQRGGASARDVFEVTVAAINSGYAISTYIIMGTIGIAILLTIGLIVRCVYCYCKVEPGKSRFERTYRKTFCMKKKKKKRAASSESRSSVSPAVVNNDGKEQQIKAIDTPEKEFEALKPKAPAVEPKNFDETEILKTKDGILCRPKKENATPDYGHTTLEKTQEDVTEKIHKEDLTKEQKRELTAAEAYTKRQDVSRARFYNANPAESTITFKYRSPKELEAMSKTKIDEEVKSSGPGVVINPANILHEVGTGKDSYVEFPVIPDAVEQDLSLSLDKTISATNTAIEGSESSEKVLTKNLSVENTQEDRTSAGDDEQERGCLSQLKHMIVGTFKRRRDSDSSHLLEDGLHSGRAAAGAEREGNGQPSKHGRKWPHPKGVRMYHKRWEHVSRPNKTKKEANINYSRTYFSKKIKKENGKLPYFFMLSEMNKKSIVEADELPETLAELEAFRPMLPANYVIDIFNEMKEVLKNEPAVLDLNRERVRVVGDIHGKYADFARQIEVGFDDTDSSYLLLGDYVDRGRRSIDVLIYKAALKISYPKRFNFLLGNHEQSPVNCYYGFYDECIQMYGQEAGDEVWFAANAMFDELPIAALLANKIFLSHAGVSPFMVNGMNVLKNLKKHPTNEQEWQLLIDLLWSDPDEAFCVSNDGALLFPLSGRADHVNNFTPRGLERIMEACKLVLIVRAHQVMARGVEPFCDEKCLTVFGATNNTKSNWASQLIIHKSTIVDVILFRNATKQTVDNNSCKTLGNFPSGSDSPRSRSSSVSTAISKTKKTTRNQKLPSGSLDHSFKRATYKKPKK